MEALPEEEKWVPKEKDAFEEIRAILFSIPGRTRGVIENCKRMNLKRVALGS